MFVLSLDESGECIPNAFFHIYGLRSAVKLPFQNDEWVLSEDPRESEWCYADATLVCDNSSKCHDSLDHKVPAALSSASLLVYNCIAGPIVPCISSLFVNASTAKALIDSKLRGVSCVEANIVEMIDGCAPMYIGGVRAQGRDAIRPRAMPVGYPNTCGKCQFGPVICPNCGYVERYNCRKCGGLIATAFWDDKCDESMLFVPPAGPVSMVVDLAAWDGCDFLTVRSADIVVTKRALNFLLERHIAPFRARPLKAFIGTCTAQQRVQLEASMKS